MRKVLLSVGCLVFICFLVASAHAACNTDCYDSCCPNDNLCQTDGELSCLNSCLEGCGDQDIPPVSDPEPVEESTN